MSSWSRTYTFSLVPGPKCGGSDGWRARGADQGVEVVEGLVELGQQFAHMRGGVADHAGGARQQQRHRAARRRQHRAGEAGLLRAVLARVAVGADLARVLHRGAGRARRSEEHTSELPSLMRNSYAVFCLNKK